MTAEPGGPPLGGEPDAAASKHVGVDLTEIGSALQALATRDEALARRLSALFTAVIGEAAKSGRFAHTLAEAFDSVAREREDPPKRATTTTRRTTSSGARPKNRRLAGAFDPFAVFADSGEQTLRSRLASLSLEQLRDIVAEHAMDNDRLAMKWKDSARVIDRIVDRVVARSSKGSAFRGDRLEPRPPLDETSSAGATESSRPDPSATGPDTRD